MLKKKVTYLLILFIVTILLPFLMVKFLPKQDFLGLIFLFFILNPIISIVFGYLTGKLNIWYFPFIYSILFVLGCWVCFSWGNLDFLVYALLYLVVGYGSAGITMLINKYKKK